MRDVGGMPEGFVRDRRAHDAALCNYLFERRRRRAEPLYVAEELGQLKSAEFASVRHAEGEAGDETLTAVEGDSGLVSVTEVVGCVRCVVLYLCVIPMRMHDATGVAANVGEQQQDAQRSAIDRWQRESSYIKYMLSVLSVRSVWHSVCTILSIHSLHYVLVSDVCSVSGDTWVLSIHP